MDLEAKLYSLDSGVINLCAQIFAWDKHRKTKGAVKLHLLLDHEDFLSHFAVINEGRTADLEVIRQMRLPEGSCLEVDRSYRDSQ
jgi:hypothetical protein